MKRYSSRKVSMDMSHLRRWDVTFTVTDLLGAEHEMACTGTWGMDAAEAIANTEKYARMAYGTRSNPREFAASRPIPTVPVVTPNVERINAVLAQMAGTGAQARHYEEM